MPERLRVAVLAGGRSAEHDISLLSAAAVVDALPLERYEPLPIRIEKDGSWPFALRPGLVDVVFPALHGPFGEDGSVQGHLETLRIPYVGCGVLASAVAMDKLTMKRICIAEGIPITPFVAFTALDWESAGPERLVRDLEWPMYVKPSNMGSSIGITRATSFEELAAGVAEALTHDRMVLVEQGVPARELVCSVLGDYDTPTASVVGEIKVGGEWLDYESKYFSQSDNVSMPADLPWSVADEVRELSLRAFRAIGGYGLARADFLYDEDAGRVYLLEINTMPGFTARSVYGRAWTASGLPYPELLTRLIDLAFARERSTCHRP